MTLQDVSASEQYKVNSPAGEYGILYVNNSAGTALKNADDTGTVSVKAGLIFYQAGIVALTASIFSGSYDAPTAGASFRNGAAGLLSQSVSGVQFSKNGTSGPALPMMSGTNNINNVLSGNAISASCDLLRHRIYNIQFNNTTELNSTIYFCRANHNEFNYSSNPTYLSSSKPMKKDPSNEFTIRVRLDY